MALFDSYTQGQTDVSNWLNRADLTTYIPDFITIGENRIYRDLRIRAMESALSGTIASGVIALPSDYIELKNAYLNTDPVSPLKRASASFIYEKYTTRSADGTPQYIGVDAGNFIFGPYPDSAYTLKGTYYARLAHLSTSSTNWFTTNAPELLLFAALCAAEPFLKNDQRLAFWNAQYEEIRDRIQDEDKREQWSGIEAPGSQISWT